MKTYDLPTWDVERRLSLYLAEWYREVYGDYPPREILEIMYERFTAGQTIIIIR